MSFSQSTPQPFTPGPALQDGSKLNAAFANPLRSITYNAIAAGANQAAATPITAAITQFSVGGNNLGGLLQTTKPGQFQDVYNDTGSTMLIYPPLGSLIDTATLNAAVNLSTGNRCRYTCFASGVIKSALLGAVSS